MNTSKQCPRCNAENFIVPFTRNYCMNCKRDLDDVSTTPIPPPPPSVKGPRPDTGGSAFPRTGFCPSTVHVEREDWTQAVASMTQPQAGMTLRDYFAAQALQAITICLLPIRPNSRKHMAGNAVEIAEWAWMIADAMLNARTDRTPLTGPPPAPFTEEEE